MKGTIKVFDIEGENLTHYWSFGSQEAYNKIMTYLQLNNVTMYEVAFDNQLN